MKQTSRPDYKVINGRRNPWTLGPLMGTEERDGRLHPVVLDSTVFLIPPHDPKEPNAGRIDVDADRWDKYEDSKHLGPTIEGLRKSGEIDVVGKAAA